MSVRLEELLIDFAANTASLDAAIDRAVAKARVAANQIDSLLSRGYGKNAQLNLTPKVDHRHLEALNKHIELKRSHLKDVQRYFDANPLTIRTNTANSEHDPRVNTHSTTQGSASQSNVPYVDNNKLEEAVSKGTEKGIKASRGGLLGAAGRLVSAPARGLASGFQEGIGLTIAQSYLKGIEKSLTVSIDNLAQQVGSTTASTVSQVTTGTLSDILGVDLGKVFGSLGELEKKVRPDSKATEEEKLAAANEALFSFGEAVFTLTKNLGLVSGKVNSQAEWLQKIGANLETKIKSAAPEVAKTAGQMHAQKINQSQAVFTVGGFARASGKSGLGIAQSLREVVDPNSVYVQGVENTATDIAPGTTDQVAIRSLGKVKELLTEVNEDAKNLAAQVIAFKRANPQTELTLLGHSAGGAVVEQTMKLLSELGEQENVKGVGLGTPALGLGKGWAENYSRITGEGDVMNYLDLLLKGNTGDVRTNVVQGGTGHTAAAYLTSPDITAALQKITGLNLKSNAKQADLQIKATLAVLDEIGNSLTQLGQLEPQFIEQEAMQLQQQLETVGSILQRNQPQVSDVLSVELEEGQLLVKQYINDLKRQIAAANQTLTSRRGQNQLERVGQPISEQTATTVANSVLGTVANIPLQAALARRERILKQHAAEIDKVFKQEPTGEATGKETGLFVIGGYAGAKGKSGHKVAAQVSKTVDTDKIGVYGLENPYTDTSVSIQEDNAKWVTEAVQKIVDVRLVKGANPDAVAAAKQIAAFLRDNPQSDVAVAGYSSGGIVTKEILKLLEMAGLSKRVRGGVALGSPDIPFDFDNPENMRMFLGDMDGVKELMRMVEKYHLVGENKTKDQNLNRLYGHTVPTYLTRPEVAGHMQKVLGSDRVKPIKYGDFAIDDMRQQFSSVAESVQMLLSGQVNPFKHAPMYTATLQQISKLKSDLHDNLRDASVEIEKELLVLVEELDSAESVIASLFGKGNAFAANQQLEKVAGAVAKLSGVSMGEIPTAIVDTQLDPNALAMMHRPTNKVRMHSVDYERLGTGEMTDGMLSTLVHEMRHKMQPRLKNLITVDQASQVLPPNVVQMLKMKAINNVKDSGAKGKQAQQVFNEEFDAYAFEHLYKQKVKEIIKNNNQLLTEIAQTLADATTQVENAPIIREDVTKPATKATVQDELTTEVLRADTLSANTSMLQAEVEGWLLGVKAAMETTLNAPVALGEFKVAADLGGASGAIFNNKDLHLVQAEAQKLLKQNALEPFKSLLHELRHLQQPNLQRLINIKDLSAIDKPFADRIRKAAERSVEWTKQQGVSDPKILEQVFAQEVDAYAFEELYAKTILGQLKGLNTKLRNQIQNSSHTRASDRRLQQLLAYYQKMQIPVGSPTTVNPDASNKVVEAVEKATEAASTLLTDLTDVTHREIEQLTQALNVQLGEVEPRRTLDFSDFTPEEFYKAYEQSIKQNLDELSKHLTGQVHGYVPRLNQSRDFTSDLGHVFDSLTSKGYENSLKSRLQQFRTAVKSGQKKLAVDLGESLMEDLRVYKEVLRQLGEQVKADPRSQWMTAYKQMSAYMGEMTKAENEIMQGSKAKGRSSVGIQQLAEDPEIRNYLGSKERGQGYLTNDLKRRQAEAEAIARRQSSQVNQGDVPLARIANPTPINQLGQAFTRTGGMARNLLQSILALAGISTISDVIVQLGRNTFQAALEFESLKTAMDFSTGGRGVETLSRLRSESDRLGVSFKETAKGYKQFSAATLGTSLQSQTDKIFAGFQEGIAARGLSKEQTSSVFTALSQITSKGKVSLEELNQQLGEAMPGALQTAAKAMGKTVPEFIKMVENGNVLAQDLLPKLAEQFSSDASSGLASASGTAQAKINRLNNALEELQIGIGSFYIEPVKSGIDTVTGGLTFFNDNIQTAAKITEIVAIALGITLVKSLLGLATHLGVGSVLMKALGINGLNLQGILLNLGTVARAVSGMLKGLIIPSAIAIGIDFLFASLNRDSQKLKDVNAALETSIRNIEEAYRKASSAASDFNNKATPKRAEPEAENPVLNWADRLVNNPLNSVVDFFGGGEQARMQREKATGREDFRFRTNAQAAEEDIIANRSDVLQRLNNVLTLSGNRLNNPKFVNQTVQELKSLDLQIQKIQAKQNVVRLEGSTEQVQALQKELEILQNKRTGVLEKVFGNRGDLENIKKQLEDARDEFNRLISIGAVTESAAASTLQFINTLLKETERQLGIVGNISKQTAAALNNLALAFGRVNASQENARYQLDLGNEKTKTSILQGQAEGMLGDNAARTTNIQAQRQYYNEQLKLLSDFTAQYQSVIDKLTTQEREALETYLGKSIESAGAGDINFVRDIYKDNITGNQEAVLNARQKILELQKEIEGAAQGIAQGAVDLRGAVREISDQARELQHSTEDFVREYSNFIRGIVDQTKEAAIDIQNLKNQVRTNDIKADLLRALTKTSKGIFGSINDLLIRYLDEAQQLTQQTLERQRQRLQQHSSIIGLQQQNQQQGRQYDNLGRQIDRFNQSNQGMGQVNVSNQGNLTEEQQFALKTTQIARDLKIDPHALMTIMLFESAGTLSPKVQGPYVPGQGRGRGLIQFMPNTATGLGTTDAALSKMTRLEQLDWVKKYFAQFKSFGSGALENLYAAVLAGDPMAVNASDGYTTARQGAKTMMRDHGPKARKLLSSISTPLSPSPTPPLAPQSSLPLTPSTLINPVPGSNRAMNSRGYAADPGLDIYAPVGTKVVAPASGKLEYAESGHNRQSKEDSDPTTPGFQPSHSIRIKLDTPIEYNGKSYPFMYFTHLRGVSPEIQGSGTHSRTPGGKPIQIAAGQTLGEVGVANKIAHLHLGVVGDRAQKSFLNYKDIDKIIYGATGGGGAGIPLSWVGGGVNFGNPKVSEGFPLKSSNNAVSVSVSGSNNALPAPAISTPEVNLGQGSSAIGKLQATQDEINQLNDLLQKQNLEQFQIRMNTDVSAAIAQRSDAYKQQRLAIRELLEQQSSFNTQYQRESIALTIVQETTNIERSFRGLRESYEKESIDLQKNIAGAEELIKTLPEQIKQLQSSGTPQDRAAALQAQRILNDAQKSLPKYQELLANVRVEHKKLTDQSKEAINFTIGESLRKATTEGNDAMRSLQRSMRDTSKEYQDLITGFTKSPSYVSELEKKLIDVDRQFEGMGDRIKDRHFELTRAVQELEAQLSSTNTQIGQMMEAGNVSGVKALTSLRDLQQAQLAENLAALAINQATHEKLPYDQRSARLIEQMRFTKVTRQEREQYLVDTQANSLEAQANFGEANYVNDEVLAKLRFTAATLRENLRFQVEMEGFDELAAKLNLTTEQAAAAKNQLAQINQINLSKIGQEADVLGQKIRQGLQPAFETFFEGLIAGGKSAGEIFTDLIGSVAKLLAQLAAQVVVKALFGGIFGTGGTVPNRAFGGSVPNYNNGGDVVGLGMAVAAAMKREGTGAVPIVASVGEEVLSTRTGDAQFYRSLRDRGIWNEMKVDNYATGGSVGSNPPAVMLRSPSGNRSDINVPVTVQYTAAAGEDERTSQTRAQQLSAGIRAAVMQELVRQQRSGGVLNR